MSHNKLTVGSQSPNSSGNISIGMNNLSDVTISSPSNDQVVKYNGSAFVNSLLVGNLDITGVYTVFQKQDYSTFSSSGTYSTNDYLFLSRDTMDSRNRSYVNASIASSNEATATNTIKSNSKFFESVTIATAGTYLCICSVPLESTDGGYTLRWHSNSGAFGAHSDVHYTNRSGSFVVGIVSAAENDVLRVVVESKSGTIGATDASKNKAFSFHIFKIS